MHLVLKRRFTSPFESSAIQLTLGGACGACGAAASVALLTPCAHIELSDDQTALHLRFHCSTSHPYGSGLP
jgi:hypothetical protein